jgi:succinate dehydrogenase / fumarate reductase flavoprotein subunit
MQGLADGYFVLPATIGDYLAPLLGDDPVPTDDPVFTDTEHEVSERVRSLLSVNGSRTVDWFHRELGKVLWENCGMERSTECLV